MNRLGHGPVKLEELVNQTANPAELNCAVDERDFFCYLRVENRFDLLREALRSIPEFWPLVTIMDNSPAGAGPHDVPLLGALYRPSVPLTFTQSHNWFFADARRRGAKFMIWMHSDACAMNYGHLRLLDFVRNHCVGKRKWGVVWTYYDSLAAVNLDMIDDVGGYDTVFPKYLCDNDHSYRMRLRGWETIDTGIHTDHLGSQTILSDPQLRFTNDLVHRLSAIYYQEKWGAGVDQERYEIPFNRPDLFPSLKPVGVW